MLPSPLLIALLASASPSPLVLHGCDFGEVYSFALPQCTATIENTGSRALSLRVAPSPPVPGIEPVLVAVPANSKAMVTLKTAIGNQVGRTVRFFAVSEAGNEATPQYLEARGFAMNVLDELRPAIEFGRVDEAMTPVQELLLSSHDTASFHITRVLAAPAQLDVAIRPDRRTLVARVKRRATWGALDDFIKLAIDTPHQREAWVAVRASIHGNVAPDANPVSLGVLAAGRAQMLQLTALRSRDGKPFKVGELKVEGINGSADVADCTPVAESCKELRLTTSEKQGPGMIQGRVGVEFPDFGKTLSIELRGFFTNSAEDASQGAPQSGQVQPDAGADNSAHKSKTISELSAEKSTPPAAPPPGTGPLLRWSVRDERSVHGYQIFRSDAESGPFVLLNVPAIPAQSDSQSGSDYQWRDNSAIKGKTYWYYIGVVYTDGRKDKITQPMHATAK